MLRAVAAFALVVSLAWLPPLRAYTQLQHRREAEQAFPAIPARGPLSEPSRARLGGLQVGDEIGGFRVTELGESAPELVWIALELGGQRVVAEIVPRGARPFSAPRSTARFDLFYRRSASDENAEAPGDDPFPALDAVAVWLRERERQP